MSVALDHDYCAVMPSEKDSTKDTRQETHCGQANMEEPVHRRKQQLSVREEICDESTNSREVVSALSPAHSMDSGVDAGVEDFLADFPSSWRDELNDFTLIDEDLEDLEALLSRNFFSNELPDTKEADDRDSRTVAVLNSSTKANFTPPKLKGNPVSDEDEQAILERNKRNAVAARENRQKKKKYVEGLESDVARLKEENKTLKTGNENMSKMIVKLSDEVKYLRSVLANQSTISLLLKSVAATPGISLTSSLVQSSVDKDEETEKENKKQQTDRQYVTRSKKRQSEEVMDSTPSKKTRGITPGGVCLHVNQGKVSLELCAKCERKAMQSGVL